MHALCMHLDAATAAATRVLRLTDTRILLYLLYLTTPLITTRTTRYAISWEAKDKLNAEVSKGALRVRRWLMARGAQLARHLTRDAVRVTESHTSHVGYRVS